MTKTILSYEPLQMRDTAKPDRYALLALLCAAAAIAYAQRSVIAVPESIMQLELQMNKDQFGKVMSAWGVGYAVAQIPSGWLGDKWGSRNTITLYALLWSAVTALVGLAGGYGSLLLIWFFMGVAQAGIFPCAARAIKRAFPEAQRASATGLLGASMGIGAAVAPMLTGLLLRFLHWRWIFVLFALPGIAWGLLFFYWLRREKVAAPHDGGKAEDEVIIRPALDVGRALPAIGSPGGQCPPYTEHLSPVEPVGSASRTIGRNLEGDGPQCGPYKSESLPTGAPIPPPDALIAFLALIGSGSMWLLCAQQFLRAAAMIFFLTWFATFLHESRGVTLFASGALTAMAGAGAVIGSLLGGFVSDYVFKISGNRRLSRQGMAVAGMLSCAVLIVTAYFIANTALSVAVIAAGTFCAAFGGVSGYTVAMDFGGKRVSTVFSIMNMCGNFGAAAFPWAIGWLVHRTGNWNLVLFIFAGIFAVDAVCWALLNPKKPLFEEER